MKAKTSLELAEENRRREVEHEILSYFLAVESYPARVAREPEPDPDPEFQAVADFLFAHGHSLQVPLSERVVFCRDRRLFDKQRHVPGW